MGGLPSVLEGGHLCHGYQTVLRSATVTPPMTQLLDRQPGVAQWNHLHSEIKKHGAVIR